MTEGFLSRWARRKREQVHAPETADDDDVAGRAPDGSAHDAADSAASRPANVPEAAGTSEAPDTAGTSSASNISSAAGAAGAPGVPGTAGAGVAGSESVPDPGRDLPPLASLTPQSDFTPFLRSGVAPATRNAALRTLFSDPHFNVMDGLDVYIDDYGIPDPIPDAMLRSLEQVRTLRLVDGLEEIGEALDALDSAGNAEPAKAIEAGDPRAASGAVTEAPPGSAGDSVADPVTDPGADPGPAAAAPQSAGDEPAPDGGPPAGKARGSAPSTPIA